MIAAALRRLAGLFLTLPEPEPRNGIMELLDQTRAVAQRQPWNAMAEGVAQVRRARKDKALAPLLSISDAYRAHAVRAAGRPAGPEPIRAPAEGGIFDTYFVGDGLGPAIVFSRPEPSPPGTRS